MRICPHCETPTLDRVCPDDGYQTVATALYMQPEHDPFVGTVFQGRYRIDERLAIGGMGTVYRGRQLAVGRTVAIKILRTEVVNDLRVVARFQQEALAVAGLHHPNTVRIFDFGQSDNGHLFLVMEFIEGESLGDLIDREAPFEPERVIHLGAQILDALAEAHQNGIIHRDLKPDNVVVTRVGLQPDFVKVLDFGIAKLDRGEARKRQITETGIVVGSPGYMAPEQVQSLEMTSQVDIYAVGAVMWEMLCGEPVFSGDSAFEIAMKQVNEAPPRPTVDGRAIEGPLVDCIMSFLQKDPAERPQGAGEALRFLQTCMPSNGAEPVTQLRPVHPHREEDPDVSLAAGRPRRSTSVFFAHGQGLSGFGGHAKWLAIIFILIGGLVYGGYRLLNRGDVDATSTSSRRANRTPPSPAADAKTKPRPPAADAASVAKTAPQTPARIGPAPASAGKKASGPAGRTPSGSQPSKTTPAPTSPAPPRTSAVPAPATPPSSPAPVAKPTVAADMAWVKVVARPKGTRIYIGKKLVGKTEVVIRWKRTEKPPRVTLRKWRYESYSFRVSPRKIGKTHRVRLEWDDSR